MLNEINSIEKSLKMGKSQKCVAKSHRNCSVTKELAFERKISKKNVRRKLRRISNRATKNSI